MKVNKFGFEDIEFIEKINILMPNKNIIWHIDNAIMLVLNYENNKIENLQKSIYFLKRSANFIDYNYFEIFKENKEISKFLTKISRVDFDIFLIIDKIIKYGISPCMDTLNECLFMINEKLKKEI